MRKLLVLGASEFQIPLLKQAKKMGFHTCILDINPKAPAIKYADEYQECSLKDDRRALEIAREYMPDGVTVGMCDVAVCTCAKICEALDLPGLPLQVAQRATDKFKMIEAFRAARVPSPEYIYFSNDSFDKNSITIPYPFICKPTDMAGSRGINLIHSEAELDAAIRDSVSSGDSGDVIVEEYMVGPEVSVEMLVKDRIAHVLQITDKYTSGAPHFVELGHTQPSSLPEETQTAISEVAIKAARALELNNCCAHAEIIVTNQGPKMVEIGARMGGDSIQEQLILYSKGINVPYYSIMMALGEDYELPNTTQNMCSTIRFLKTDQRGVVKAIRNVEEARNMNGIRQIELFCYAGDTVDAPKDSSGRLGYVISQAATVAESISSCESAVAMIDIVIESD